MTTLETRRSVASLLWSREMAIAVGHALLILASFFGLMLRGSL